AGVAQSTAGGAPSSLAPSLGSELAPARMATSHSVLSAESSTTSRSISGKLSRNLGTSGASSTAIGRIGHYAQRPLARGRECLRQLTYLLDLAADGACVWQHRLTRRGQENPARRATHELHADGLFQVCDGATDRDFRHLVGAGGGGESV